MEFNYKVKIGDDITSTSSVYRIQKTLGCGYYGDVTLCRKNHTDRLVAIKLLKDLQDEDVGQKETKILQKMRENGSSNYNIVQWNDAFKFQGHYCLEFEKLDISLFEFLEKSEFNSLQLREIRPIIHQVAESLLFLKSLGIMHTDLKPDNIMMVDHVAQPLRIKLIDFGLACSVSEVKQGTVMQPVWYRAPEVLLGGKVDVPIDMWSVGCIVAEMFLGNALFQARDPEDLMRHMVLTVGQPPKHLLDSGCYTHKYFRRPEGCTDWECEINLYHPQCRRTVSQLDDIFMCDPYRHVNGNDPADYYDRIIFIDLLKKMLDMNPDTRVTPLEVIQHPFLTLSHLFGGFCDYLKLSQALSYSYQGNLDIMTHVLGEKQVSKSFTHTSVGPHTSVATQGQRSPCKRRRDDNEIQKCFLKCQEEQASTSTALTQKCSWKRRRQSHVINQDQVIVISSNLSKKRRCNNAGDSPAKKIRAADHGHYSDDVITIESSVSRKRKEKNEVVVIDLTSPSPPKQRRLSAGPEDRQ